MHLEDKPLSSYIADHIIAIQLRQATKYLVESEDIHEEVTKSYIDLIRQVDEFKELQQIIYKRLYLINDQLPPISKSTLAYFPEAQI